MSLFIYRLLGYIQFETLFVVTLVSQSFKVGLNFYGNENFERRNYIHFLPDLPFQFPFPFYLIVLPTVRYKLREGKEEGGACERKGGR